MSKGVIGPLSRRLPSPAMVVACIALIVALGGTSYAAIKLPANSVGTKQLKRGAVTGPKVSSNTLTGAQINEARLGKPAAAQADEATSADRAALSRLHYQQLQVAIPGGGGFVRQGITCETGLSATGGGAKVSDPNNAVILDTNPPRENGLGGHSHRRCVRKLADRLRHLRPGRDDDTIGTAQPVQRSQRTTSARGFRRRVKTLEPLLGSSSPAG
jgi:hypothetical protein